MNCKPGDMAVVIAGTKGTQVGKTCTCIRLLARHEHNVPDVFGPMWEVDCLMSFTQPGGAQIWRSHAPDRFLMPINPRNDEETEAPEALLTE